MYTLDRCHHVGEGRRDGNTRKICRQYSFEGLCRIDTTDRPLVGEQVSVLHWWHNISAYNGKIRGGSSVVQGSTFCFQIPTAPEKHEPSA